MAQEEAPHPQPSDMPGQRQRGRLRRPTDAAMARAVRLAEESGELAHLYGKPLDLSDETADWFTKKMLKDRGFTHPLLEQAKELDQARDAVEIIADRIQRRYSWLTRRDHLITLAEAEKFNAERLDALDRYRDQLTKLNSAILSHNLRSPDALHQRQVNVDQMVARLEEEVPSLLPSTRVAESPMLNWLGKLRSGLHAGRRSRR